MQSRIYVRKEGRRGVNIPPMVTAFNMLDFENDDTNEIMCSRQRHYSFKRYVDQTLQYFQE